MSDEHQRTGKTRGRKRDTERTAAILAATAELLVEVGFDRLRIQDVAERAGAGTGAIYRRWPKKEALFAEAIRAMPELEAPVTPDAVADFRSLVSERCAWAAENPDIMPGLVSAMRADEGIERAVKDGFSVAYFRDTVRRIVGDDHPHLDLLGDLVPAVLLFRAAFSPETIDADATTDELVSFVSAVARKSE